MRVERISPTLEALDDLFGFEAICAFLTEDERPFSGALGLVDWRLCGALSRVVKSGFFHAAPSERLLLPTDGRVNAGRIFVVGLGPMSAVTAMGLEHELGKAGEMLEGAGVASVALAFPRLPPAVDAVRDEVVDRAFVGGFPGRVGVFGA